MILGILRIEISNYVGYVYRKLKGKDFVSMCTVFPTSVWSEPSEKSEYLMNFRHMFVYVIFRSKRKYQ